MGKASSIYVSSASLWEVAIKHSLGKLPVGAEEVRDQLRRSGAEFLPILPEHCLALAGLPSLHGDPFDRMLIAQAIVEPMHLVTHDQAMHGYPGSIHFV
jgi:PIN domain nuclease of toxin-antitoxin system